MSKPETSFTQSIHKHLPPGRRDPYWMKNNNLYTSGIWDVWYSGKAADLWVEYKFITLPKRAGTLIDPGLSELQLLWGRERYAEGRNLAVIVGCKEGGVIVRDPNEWEHPMTAADFIERIKPRQYLARWLACYTMQGIE